MSQHHMSAKALQLAAQHFKLSPSRLKCPTESPTGMIVGESGRPELPEGGLFPWPANTTGGKLLKLSKVTHTDYLGKLLLVNLFVGPMELNWNYAAAEERAKALSDLIGEGRGMRCVLVGALVGAAFGISDYFTVYERRGSMWACIPHPIALTHNLHARVGGRAALQWATGTLKRDATTDTTNARVDYTIGDK